MVKSYSNTLVVWVVLFVFTVTSCGGAAVGSAPAANEPATEAADVDAPAATKAAGVSAEEEEEEKDIAAAESETLSPEDQKKADEMAKALALIESIPDSVIAQGEDAVAQWLKERQPEVSPKGLPGCVAMVGKFLLENFTILKILRIKKTLEALGGAAKFANLTFKLFRKYKKKGLGTKAAIEKAVRVASKRSGKEASALLLQLFGATEVIDACAEV